ncbi:unnamed protein product [Arctogadus glacialis]
MVRFGRLTSGYSWDLLPLDSAIPESSAPPQCQVHSSAFGSQSCQLRDMAGGPANTCPGGGVYIGRDWRKRLLHVLLTL